MQIRVARPTDKLAEVVRFYRDGMGLPVIVHFEDHAGYSGVILGTPAGDLHLEFTHAVAGSPGPAPSKDNLLVLYIPEDKAHGEAVRRLKDQGYQTVEPENPYWKGTSDTFEDPDGWRVVLYHGDAFVTQRDGRQSEAMGC